MVERKAMGGEWIMEVRGMLFALAQTTDSTLPPSNVQDVYIRKLFEVSGDGTFATLLISDAIEALIAEWKYPSFPKVADILKHMRLIRVSYAFREKCEKLMPPEIPEHATDRPQDRERVVRIIAEWRKDGGNDYGKLSRMLKKEAM
jgi:hypothetical protein